MSQFILPEAGAGADLLIDEARRRGRRRRFRNTVIGAITLATLGAMLLAGGVRVTVGGAGPAAAAPQAPPQVVNRAGEAVPYATDRALVRCLMKTGATVAPSADSPHIQPGWNAYADYGRNGAYFLVIMESQSVAARAAQTIKYPDGGSGSWIGPGIPFIVGTARNVLYFLDEGGNDHVRDLVELCADGVG